MADEQKLPGYLKRVTKDLEIKELDVEKEKFFLANVTEFSHCYASDVFVNYPTPRSVSARRSPR